MKSAVRKSRKMFGFTLLELLVVIGIIAVLVSLGTSSYSTAQKKARDTKRRSDVRSIANGLEQYYSICNFQYPSSLAVGALSGTVTSSSCPSTTFSFTYPTDPQGYNYQCVGTCDSSAFTICPSDSVNGGKRLETEDCTSNNCCLTNQQ